MRMLYTSRREPLVQGRLSTDSEIRNKFLFVCTRWSNICISYRHDSVKSYDKTHNNTIITDVTVTVSPECLVRLCSKQIENI
jgi:hypothetical protein